MTPEPWRPVIERREQVGPQAIDDFRRLGGTSSGSDQIRPAFGSKLSLQKGDGGLTTIEAFLTEIEIAEIAAVVIHAAGLRRRCAKFNGKIVVATSSPRTARS